MLRKSCLVGLALTSLLGYSQLVTAQEEVSSEKKATKTTTAENQPRKLVRKLKVFKLQHSKPSELAQLFAARHTAFSAFGGAGSAPGAPGLAAHDVEATASAAANREKPMADQPVNTAHDDEKRVLFVRGSEDQIKRIEKLVKAFDVPAAKLEKQKWDDLHLIPIRGADAGNIQSILSQLGLSTHAVQLGETSVIVLQESDDEEADQILEILSELESAEDRATTKKTTTEKTTTENDRERR
jgi:vacuolar-type H+-ATPase subunit I/STV1